MDSKLPDRFRITRALLDLWNGQGRVPFYESIATIGKGPAFPCEQDGIDADSLIAALGFLRRCGYRLDSRSLPGEFQGNHVYDGDERRMAVVRRELLRSFDAWSERILRSVAPSTAVSSSEHFAS